MQPLPQGLVVPQRSEYAISKWKRLCLEQMMIAYIRCQVPVLLLPGKLAESDREILRNVCRILLQQPGSRGAMNAYYVMFKSGLSKKSALTMIGARILRSLIVTRAWGETNRLPCWSSVRSILEEHVGCWDCDDTEEERFWSQITGAYVKLLPEDETKRDKIRYHYHRSYPLTTEVPMPRFLDVPKADDVPMPRLYIARIPAGLET